jgi:hypothetical protein
VCILVCMTFNSWILIWCILSVTLYNLLIMLPPSSVIIAYNITCVLSLTCFGLIWGHLQRLIFKIILPPIQNIAGICKQIIIHNFYQLIARLLRSYPCNRPWRPLGLWDVEAPIFSRQSAHRWWGCQTYALAAPYPQEDFWYSFLLEAESTPRP